MSLTVGASYSLLGVSDSQTIPVLFTQSYGVSMLFTQTLDEYSV